jgi:hypothetical protein
MQLAKMESSEFLIVPFCVQMANTQICRNLKLLHFMEMTNIQSCRIFKVPVFMEITNSEPCGIL